MIFRRDGRRGDVGDVMGDMLKRVTRKWKRSCRAGMQERSSIGKN